MTNENKKNPASSVTEEASQSAAETAAKETAQAEEKSGKKSKKPKKAKKNRRSFKEVVKTEKFRRSGISAAFTAGFIVVVILINVIVGLLGERYPSMNVDLTKNHTNTLSTQAASIVDKVKTPVTIYIIATESQTKSDRIIAGYSQVGELAAKMAERNRNISVKYIDLDTNPTFASDYRSDNITVGNVIIRSNKRYRVLTVTDLFNVSYNPDGTMGGTSMVDSALASGLNSVISESVSIAAFDTGHSEQMDTTTYKKLLSNNSFETKDFNLLTDAIPTGARLVVLGCPTTDYTDSEIQKLDAFLSSSSLAGDRSLLITFHPSQTAMPKLSAFLKEWGISVTPQTIVVESDSSKYYTSDPSFILSNLETTLDLGGSSSYNKYYTTPQSSPINILYDTKGTRQTYSLSKSNDTCYLVDNNTKEGDKPAKAAYHTGVLSQDTVKAGGKEYKANVIALGSTTMFNSDILAPNTFANAAYLVDLSRYATGTTNATTAITETPVDTNVQDIDLSTGTSILLGLGVFTLLIPLTIVIAGICVYRRRRHL